MYDTGDTAESWIFPWIDTGLIDETDGGFSTDFSWDAIHLAPEEELYTEYPDEAAYGSTLTAIRFESEGEYHPAREESMVLVEGDFSKLIYDDEAVFHNLREESVTSSISGMDFRPMAVPEPSSMALLGIVGVVVYFRHRASIKRRL